MEPRTATASGSFGVQWPVWGLEPDGAWAVPLTDEQHAFRLLPADFDASTHGADGAAARAEALAAVLTTLAIPHLVTESGPSGGRHVWLGRLIEAADSETVAQLAHQLQDAFGIDIAPLKNRKTGAVRPPGAPHRNGGRSRVLTGDPDILITPCVSLDQLEQLRAHLAADSPTDDNTADQPDATPTQARPRSVGHGEARRLDVRRRPLSPAIIGILDADAETANHHTSGRAWQVLIGCALAGWPLADVRALLDTKALAHIRTVRDLQGRVPRPRREQDAILARQWDKALVRAADLTATRPRSSEASADFLARWEAANAVVAAVQARADACPGRWHRVAGGALDRLVLDAICLIVATSTKTVVALSHRRIAELIGGSRDLTASLRRLQDGWIALETEADGTNATSYSLIHSPESEALSQGGPWPPAVAPALQAKLKAARTDALAGTEYRTRLAWLALDPKQPQTDQDLNARGIAPHTLATLASHGLAVHTSRGWRRAGQDRCRAIAERRGCKGILRWRKAKYAAEQEDWRLWCGEVDWLGTPRHLKRRTRRTLVVHRPGREPLCLKPHHRTRHPVTGRAHRATFRDRRAAWRIAPDGRAVPRLSVPDRPTRPAPTPTLAAPRDPDRSVTESVALQLVTEALGATPILDRTIELTLAEPDDPWEWARELAAGGPQSARKGLRTDLTAG